MIARAVATLLATACLLSAGRARADAYDELGRLERQEVDAVLGERGLTVDRAPAGKSIGQVIVATRDVFSARDGFLTVFNIFHATTRERIVRRELLFGPGDPWDQEVVDETLRNVRDPLYHNVVVIVPVESGTPGQVDVLVVIRDIWSLRLNSRYEVQDVDIIELSFSLSENNLFGFRKRLAMAFFMDLGTVQVGPSYIDPNVLGTRLTLRSSWRLVFARHGNNDFEGTRSETTLAYPIWSLRRKWGASLAVSHSVGFDRRFKGIGLRTYDNPDTMDVEMEPWIYHRRQLVTEAQVARAFGSTIRQTVALGHQLSIDRPKVTDDFMGDATLRAAFERDVLPRSELASSLFAVYELYTPVYGAYRDLDTFDFREDFQLGPLVSARASAARPEIGSERSFFRLSASARWSSGWRGGLWRIAAGASARIEDGDAIDQTRAVSALAVTPALGRWLRVVVSFSLEWLVNEVEPRFFALGGTNGLRGYAVNELIGKTARAIGHLELRTRPLRIGFWRLGAVAFWDAGDCADALGELALHHGVGVGLRSLIPQLDPLVIRIDWAIPVERGFPGRVSFGVEQAF